MSQQPPYKRFPMIGNPIAISLAPRYNPVYQPVSNNCTLYHKVKQLGCRAARQVTKFICLNCFYEWGSGLSRNEIRCPGCHRRWGVELARFDRTVEQAVTAIEEAMARFPVPINPLTAFGLVSSLLVTIGASIGGEFPDPLLPPRVAAEVWNRAVQRINRRQQQGPWSLP